MDINIAASIPNLILLILNFTRCIKQKDWSKFDKFFITIVLSLLVIYYTIMFFIDSKIYMLIIIAIIGNIIATFRPKFGIEFEKSNVDD